MKPVSYEEYLQEPKSLDLETALKLYRRFWKKSAWTRMLWSGMRNYPR